MWSSLVCDCLTSGVGSQEEIWVVWRKHMVLEAKCAALVKGDCYDCLEESRPGPFVDLPEALMALYTTLRLG